MVRGRIHYTRWTDQENIERYGVEIIADKVTFLSRGRQNQGGTQDHGGLDDDDVPSDQERAARRIKLRAALVRLPLVSTSPLREQVLREPRNANCTTSGSRFR